MTKRLLATYMTITLFVLAVLAIPLGIVFARIERDRLTARLESDASVLATLVEEPLEENQPFDFQRVAADYASDSDARVVITDGQGLSVADTESESGRRFASRPEISSALDGDRASGIRHSETLGTDLFYVAVPVASAGEVYGAVRLSFPTDEVDSRVTRAWLALAALGLVVLAATAFVGWILARSVTKPMRDLEIASGRLAGGDLDARAPESYGPPEIRHLAAEFNSMAARLQDLVASQNAFVADASHQLRTPLTALRLRIENLADDGIDEDDREAALAEIDRLTDLVNQLLLLARTDAAEQNLTRIDLGALLRERQSAWQPLAEDKGVVVRLDAPKSLSVVAIPGALEQIVDNLLENAIEVAPVGSEVALCAAETTGVAHLHVVDGGPGMSDSERLHAFDRFWQADPKRAGSGLGLSIVQELTERCGGEIRLEPAQPSGIDAHVRLSRARPASDGRISR